jgi:hypothetical protein
VGEEAITSDIFGFVPFILYARGKIVRYVHNGQAQILRRIRTVEAGLLAADIS